MKTNLLLRLLPAALVVAFLFPQWARAESFKKDQHGIVLNVKTGTLRLQVWSERIVRVTYTTATTLPADNSLAVIAKPDETQWNAAELAGSIILTTKFLRIEIDPGSAPSISRTPGENPFLPSHPAAVSGWRRSNSSGGRRGTSNRSSSSRRMRRFSAWVSIRMGG